MHHTDTTNSEPDPAATLRAIYRYHVVTQGWADIGYNFLVDESGRIWEGRWSRSYPVGTSPSGDDSLGRGVTGSHTSGWNTGTVGIALLGPGGTFYATLPAIRADVAARLAPAAPAPASDTSPPSVPTDLFATGGVKKVVLRWSASTDDTGVTGYLVSRSSTGSPGSFTQVATTTAPGWTDSGLRGGRTYYYSVGQAGGGQRDSESCP